MIKRGTKPTKSNPYRSGLEGKMATLLKGLRVDFKYEDKTQILHYERPATFHKYYPDWIVEGMVLETKGIWLPDDREKILFVIGQNPGIDLRMVFQNPKLPIYKGSKTTYAMWCDKKKIKWGTLADVPQWIKDKKNDQS